MSVRLLPFLALLLAGCGGALDDQDGDGVSADLDCNDGDAAIAPGLPDQVGDGVDQDCDGIDGVDRDGDGEPSAESGGLDCEDRDPTTLGPDGDGDGFSDCADCDPQNPLVNPGAVDVCNSRDDDCDGQPDRDADGLGVCAIELAVTPLVDVLFLVDNDTTTIDWQEELGSAFPDLLAALDAADADYHVGVVTSDVGDEGRLETRAGLKWVEPSEPNGAVVLQSMAQLGSLGGPEQAFDALILALDDQADGFNVGFQRPTASLHVVALSANDEHSATTVPQMTSFLQTLRPLAPSPTFHSVVPVGALCPSAIAVGSRYLELSQATGGMEVDLCSPPWTSSLTSLADLAVADAPTDSFVIGFDVAPSSLRAEVRDAAGTVLDTFDAASLSWDPELQAVTLPIVVGLDQQVVLFYAGA